ncbi:FecR family protein [Pontibacter mangrovi]|uniref:DUF4974 domain-containing protein n=1 Tax=Pontibacter mangrovi TaxID=2589816 RepID=A0A501WL39_9BACT|nr:FecR domain-containing protein [Pontibacter mangrovi]TPE46366.1 DUF4974 domain-containing protein [Pontibacter mangrovi]
MNSRLASATDLAADEQFVQWVQSPTAKSTLYWENWLAQNPEKQEAFRQAQDLVLMLKAGEEARQLGVLDEVWDELQAEIKGAAGEPAYGSHPGWWQRNSWLVAASTVLLLVSGMVLMLSWPQQARFRTGYGEKLTVQLPDDSKVVLNANSSAVYSDGWFGITPRKVRLSGEAYFSVTHTANSQRFIVETLDGAAIEVLGTEFNVMNRENRSQVVLASGVVRLNYEKQGNIKRLNLVPGEMAEISGNIGLLAHKKVNTAIYTSWKDNKVIFDNTSLQDIAAMLEHLYGFEVKLAEPELAELRLTANLQDEGPENILAVVSETLGVRVNKLENNQTILITNTN